jgi:hypothetical protein
VTLSVPAAAPDAVSTTIALRIAGPPDVEPAVLEQSADGSLQLSASDAVVHGRQIQVETRNRREHLGYWTDAADWVEWPFVVRRPGRFVVTAEMAAVGSGAFEVIVGTTRLKATAPVTGDYARFQTVELGVVEMPAAGRSTLAIKPIAAGWQPMNLRMVRLKPAPE